MDKIILAIVLMTCAWTNVSGVKKISNVEEPQCLSRFDFDYKVLSQLMTLDKTQEDFLETFKKQEAALREIQDKREEDLEVFNSRITDLQIKNRQLASTFPRQGATYIRWGRTACPENGTELVYAGYAGGSMFDHRGGAANFLCLPTDPEWGVFEDRVQSGAEIYGAEYQLDARDIPSFFKQSLRDSDVPCAVCRSIRPSVLMIPAKKSCHIGWTLEYTGYLTAGHASHTATEFICLDGQPEVVKDTGRNDNGKLLYFAEGRCGSLPCPPYVNGREFTCVVCTK